MSLSEKTGLASVCLSIIAIIAAIMYPETRRLMKLDKPLPIQDVNTPSGQPISTVSGVQSEKGRSVEQALRPLAETPSVKKASEKAAPKLSKPRFGELPQEWLEGRLYGNSTDVSALGPVTIRGDEQNGYKVQIISQDTVNCGLSAGASGNPSELRNCTMSGGWTILTKEIQLQCSELRTEVVCKGMYKLRPDDHKQDADFDQTWNLTIARRK